jgi:hypothetical protein
MKKLLFVASALAALSLLAPSSGFAQADNQIGVYFDTAGTVTDFTPEAIVAFDCYVLLTQPRDLVDVQVTEVEAFEFMVTFQNGAGVIKNGETLPPGAINVGNSNSPAAGLGYTVGLAVPVVVVDGIATLVTISLLVLTVEENFIYLNNSSTGNMYYQEGASGTLVDFHPSSGNSADPVAAIAGTVTPVEASTWGGVKSLYR